MFGFFFNNYFVVVVFVEITIKMKSILFVSKPTIRLKTSPLMS